VQGVSPGRSGNPAGGCPGPIAARVAPMRAYALGSGWASFQPSSVFRSASSGTRSMLSCRRTSAWPTVGLVPPRLHARLQSLGKTYFYQIPHRSFVPPQRYRYFCTRGAISMWPPCAARRLTSWSLRLSLVLDRQRRVGPHGTSREVAAGGAGGLGVRIFVTADGFSTDGSPAWSGSSSRSGRGTLGAARDRGGSAMRPTGGLAPPTPPAHGSFSWRVQLPFEPPRPGKPGGGGEERARTGGTARARLGAHIEEECVKTAGGTAESCRSAWLTGLERDVTSRNARDRTREETPRES